MNRKQEQETIQKPLEALGFRLTQQGGGQVNYQRTVYPSKPWEGDMTEILCNVENGEVPEDLDETIELYRFREEDGPEFPAERCTLREWLARHGTEE